MKLHVDQERCIGAGECILLAPEVFGLNEESGKAELLNADEAVSSELLEDIEEAVEYCPVGAITLLR